MINQSETCTLNLRTIQRSSLLCEKTCLKWSGIVSILPKSFYVYPVSCTDITLAICLLVSYHKQCLIKVSVNNCSPRVAPHIDTCGFVLDLGIGSSLTSLLVQQTFKNKRTQHNQMLCAAMRLRSCSRLYHYVFPNFVSTYIFELL